MVYSSVLIGTEVKVMEEDWEEDEWKEDDETDDDDEEW